MTNISRRSRFLALSGMLLAATALSGAPSVAAKSGDVIRTGNCTRATDWKLKLSPENGRIEVEFEVDSNRTGQRWSVVLKQNGAEVLRTARTTVAPSGSFEVRKVVPNRSGTDRITAWARNAATGETCTGVASF
jgi:hypothetical protein